MLEYLTALTMLLLVFGHALLIKKCTKLTDEIEPSAGKLSSEMSDITGLLNELCDIIHEATNSLIPKAAQTAQTGFDLPSLLTNLLMPKPPLPVDEGERIWQEIENPAGTQERLQQEQDEENLQPI
jgi:hypothetical protein